MAAVANSARRVLTAAASEANVAVRRFHAAPARSAAAGGSGNEPAYLHAYHMYDIPSIKNRKLKFGVAVVGSVTFAIAVPLIAVWHQQIKARG